MLDQSFSDENFRKIFDVQNRKGVFLEARYFPAIEKISIEIKQVTTDLKELRKIRSTLTKDKYEADAEAFKNKLHRLKKEKEERLCAELAAISAKVYSRKFTFDLRSHKSPGDKTVYTLVDSAESYFAIKQLQNNIRKLYSVKQAGRYQILRHLQGLLGDQIPKQLVRIDIHQFFESIPTKKLLKKIDDDQLLSAVSKKFIKQILYRYQELSGSDIGIPRGIGISSYLAELYLNKFDTEVRADKDLIYYGRYVDDVIAIYASEFPVNLLQRVLRLKRTAKNYDLRLNDSKTKIMALPQGAPGEAFDYLGFCITPLQDAVHFEFTARKLSKYNKRIDRVFASYISQSRLNEKKARSLLEKRVRFLTGNSRLLNNKRFALIGIYFSNPLLNKIPESLDTIDQHLRYKISLLSSARLKKRLDKLSFKDGFSQRRFSPFNIHDFSRIVEAWQHEI